jgi:hypothetical protein
MIVGLTPGEQTRDFFHLLSHDLTAEPQRFEETCYIFKKLPPYIYPGGIRSHNP